MINIIKHIVKQKIIFALGKLFGRTLSDLALIYFKEKSIPKLQTEEFEILRQLTMLLSIKVGFAVDIAASDGVTQSCTLQLYKNGWPGLAVEMNSEKFSQLSFLYKQFNNVQLSKCKITPRNVVSLLEAHAVPKDFEILNLDIDSYDLEVVLAILKSEYKPKIITMEYNEKIPPSIYFSVNFEEEHFWNGDHFYGCSISAANLEVTKYGYVLYKIHANNAFFILNEKSKLVSKNVHIEYQEGYMKLPNRVVDFHYNLSLDYWQDLPAETAIKEIKSLFKNYEGKYICYAIE